MKRGPRIGPVLFGLIVGSGLALTIIGALSIIGVLTGVLRLAL